MESGHVRAIALLALSAASLVAGSAEDRARQIQDKLLAPCCYSESLTVHRSELAARLRSDIRKAVDQGKSDREIIDGYIAQYGLRVLREPEGQRRTWLHIVPVVTIMLGILVLALTLKRLRRSIAPQPPVSVPPVAGDDDLW